MLRKPTLSIVIPAYNEESRLPPFLTLLMTRWKDDVEFIVVDDGSRDRTSAVAAELVGRRGKVISLAQNQGKGAAVRTGIEAATGTYVCVTDADGSASLSAFDEALHILRNSQSHGVIGVRYAGQARRKITWYRHLLGQLFVNLTHWLLDLDYQDTQCGFKMFRTSSAQILFAECRETRFAIDFELLYVASLYGVRFIELPIGWMEREGTKVRILRDGLAMIRSMLRIRQAQFFRPEVAAELSKPLPPPLKKSA